MMNRVITTIGILGACAIGLFVHWVLGVLVIALLCIYLKLLNARLYAAATSGEERTVRRLLTMGGNINARNRNGFTLLFGAVVNGHLSMVNLLAGRGADVNRRPTGKYADQSPLSHAIDASRPDIAESLIKARARIPEMTVTTGTDDSDLLLHRAVHGGMKSIAHLLVEAGANVNVTNRQGQTPLHSAWHNIEMIQQLIADGADVNAQDGEGNTPLFACAGAWESAPVACLIQHGANANATNRMKQTPLHYMFQNLKYTSSLSMYLREKGAHSVDFHDTVDSMVNLPEAGAIADTARLLTNGGAKPNERDSEGKTPLDYVPKGTRLERMLSESGFRRSH